MKKFLYILSLFSFLLALLVIIVIPLDEIFAAKYFIAVALLIISSLLRIFSNSQKAIWVDFLVLVTSLILITIGTSLLSPTTQFLITYGEKFNKIYAGALSLFPIIQLFFIFRKEGAISKTRYLMVFILTIIFTSIMLLSIEVYGKTIDLQKLSDSKKIYLYSYGKYTPELIKLAIYEIEYGNSVSKKMALNYISKNDRVIAENSSSLERILFEETLISNSNQPVEYNSVEMEEKLNLMIKISPEKTLSVIMNYIAKDNINNNLTIINALKKIIVTSPSLINRSCEVVREIVRVENNRSRQKNLSYPDTDLMRLKTYTQNLTEKCGDLRLK